MTDRDKKLALWAVGGIAVAAVLILILTRRPTIIADDTSAPLPQLLGLPSRGDGSPTYLNYNGKSYDRNPFPIISPLDMGIGSDCGCTPKCSRMVGGVQTPSLPAYSAFMYGGWTMINIRNLFGRGVETIPASSPDIYKTPGVTNVIQTSGGHTALFSRDQQEVIFNPYSTMVPQPETNYPDFGYIPNVAQKLYSDIGDPKIMTPPWFTAKDLGHAMWFTTRTILNPLGNAE
jgi:hypothetical protein